MSLQSRLGKLERSCSADNLDLSKLTEDELKAQIVKSVEQIGIDWRTFQNDPVGTLKEHFEGVEGHEGSLAGLIKLISEANIIF